MARSQVGYKVAIQKPNTPHGLGNGSGRGPSVLKRSQKERPVCRGFCDSGVRFFSAVFRGDCPFVCFFAVALGRALDHRRRSTGRMSSFPSSKRSCSRWKPSSTLPRGSVHRSARRTLRSLGPISSATSRASSPTARRHARKSVPVCARGAAAFSGFLALDMLAASRLPAPGQKRNLRTLRCTHENPARAS